MADFYLRMLETPDEMKAVEELQRMTWSGDERGIAPDHLLLSIVENGGIAVGAFAPSASEQMIGFVFGFPGLYYTPDGPRAKHCSHMLAVHPGYQNLGVGFALKRAQWQMVRHQGLDCATWTYDPLLSRNAYLNISKLGAVCNTYLRNAYGKMQDNLNAGLPTDRFQVDWWINSVRTTHRLSKRRRQPLGLAHFLSAGVIILNPSQETGSDLPVPAPTERVEQRLGSLEGEPLLLFEIPSNFSRARQIDGGLASEWRLHGRALFEQLFQKGYLVTDFVYLPGQAPRSFYVLSYGESTL